MVNLFVFTSLFLLELGQPVSLGEPISFELKAPTYYGWLYVGDSSHIYLISYSEHTIHQFDEAGNFIRSIGRKGSGPGELHKPVFTLELDKQRLLVVESMGRMSLFDFTKGAFIKVINKYFPCSRILPYDDQHFLSIMNKTNHLAAQCG